MGSFPGVVPRKPNSGQPGSKDPVSEVSSVSDTSPEEDMALCLMMLSRDSWSSSNKQRKKKVFRSFQALGGHRTSHKKIASNDRFQEEEEEGGDDDDDDGSEPVKDGVGTSGNLEEKVYGCPFCDRVFGSGQALGGHKRSHFLSSAAATTMVVSESSCKLQKITLIDLNLPAPMEEEDEEEDSALSDAEFVNPIKH